jgi:diguanylate cyclase (GGDEF)-like protein
LRNEAVDAVHVAGVEAAFFHNLIIPLGAGLSGWVAENRRTIVNGNPAVEFGYLQDSTRFTTLRSALSVPLEGVSGVTGVMTLYSSKPDAFTQDDLRVLLAINSKIGLVIENAPTRYQPPAPSGTDSLTGLASATSLFYHVGNLIDSDEPFSVLTVDLDGFQDVNQRYGHPEGNRILNAASHKLRSFCRESDFIARMGGDEFALVWRGVDRIQAEIRARELADAAVVNGLPGGGAVHMSVGTASFPADGSTVEALLSEADRRMYQMKGVHRSHRVTLEQMAPVQTIM